MLSALDQTRLNQALALAESAIGVSDPNPRVGCIIGWPDGRVAGRGFTQRAGNHHAEMMALHDAQAAGIPPQGATAWVTLEPCAHHGRTPPCCDALIVAGIARVVVAVQDPFDAVDGKGIARLRAAGIAVTMVDPDTAVAIAARELNIGFFSRVLRSRPWVRMKIAASLDGCTALLNGQSQWITGADARADGHRWRKRAGAVMTGIGTVVADNPRLDVRFVPTERQPLRVVVDSQLQLPTNAKLFEVPGTVLVAVAVEDPVRRSQLEERGAQFVLLPNSDGKVDLHALMSTLAKREINEVHVEAGHNLNGSLLQAGLVDELLIYLAPVLLGAGRGMAAFGPLERLAQGLQFALQDVVHIGNDLRLLCRSPVGTAFATNALV